MRNNFKKYSRKEFINTTAKAALGLSFINGRSLKIIDEEFSIIIFSDKDPYEMAAANLFRSTILKKFNKTLQISFYRKIGTQKKGLLVQNTGSGFAKDAFEISSGDFTKIQGNNLGLLFGVGELLEKYYGIIKTDIKDYKIYSGAFSAPKNFRINSKPDFQYRFFYQQLGFDKEYRSYNKLSNFYTDKESGWIANEDTGSVVHNFLTLFGFDTHFKLHPEYYPYIKNKRTEEGLQINNPRRMPCLSSEGVYQIMKSALNAKIESNTAFKIWNLSQVDGMTDSDGYCNCELCKPKHDAGNGFSETFFPFINRIAADFPDKIIRTLAYTVTSKPHKGISILSGGKKLLAGEMLKNVEIIITLTDNDKSKSIATSNDKGALELRKYIEDWKRKKVTLFIWEYIVNFNYYLFPFPTLHTIKNNFEYFKNNNVKSIFINSSSMEQSSLSELNAYVYSKMMWDYSQDINELIRAFCNDFYGPASQQMYSYILSLLANVKKNEGTALNPFSGIGSMVYLSNPDKYTEDTVLFSPKHMTEYLSYITLGLDKTKDTKYYNNVLKEYACLLFVQIESATKYANKNGQFNPDFYAMITRNYKYNISDIKNEFAYICKNLNIQFISEGQRTVESYLKDVGNL